jgi:hypothetical protein
MKYLRLLVVSTALVTCVGDQVPVDVKTLIGSMDTNDDGVVDEEEIAAATEAEAGVTDVIKDGTDMVDTITTVVERKDKLSGGMIALLVLGAVFKLLLSLIKVIGKNIVWFKTKDGKRAIKYSTLGLGAAAGLVANLAFGVHWAQALEIMLSGPLAVAIHEYTKDSKDSSKERSDPARA